MISSFLFALESAFSWLLTASWQASVLVALVLFLQSTLRSRLNPRWYHALWLLVVARLLLPALPESALSLFQFTPQPPPAFIQPVTEPWQPLFTGKSYPSPHDPSPTVIPNYPFSYFTLLAIIWLAGAIGLLVLTLIVNYRFARHVANTPEFTDPDLLRILAAARNELRVHRPLRLIESSQIEGPAIMGLFHPTLILPQNVRAKFTDDELRFIFLHELAHLKRGDLILQWLVALLQVLHWFNPVLWYAFRRMRADREPATDALVLSRTGEAEKERYGHVLIKLLEHFNQRHSLPTLIGLLEDKDQFKRRFQLIAKFTGSAYAWSLLGVFLIAALGAIGLTKAKAQDTASKADPYLETILVESPGAFNGWGEGPRAPEDILKMLRDPNNTVTPLAHVALKDGPISLQGETTANFDYTIKGDWKSSATEPQNIDIRIDSHSTPGLHRSWETTDKISNGQPLVVFQSWKTTSHANLVIRIVDHPSSVATATDADPKMVPTDGTLAELVLALKDKTNAIPSDHQRLQILQAFYGADGSWRDVTSILQKSVENNSLKVSWNQPYSEIGGDPAYGQVKTLIVSYRLDGVEKLATFREENFPVGLQAVIPTDNQGNSSSIQPATTNTPPQSSAQQLIPSSPLRDAIVQDQASVVNLLLEEGAAIDEFDLPMALTVGRNVIAKLLWEHGARQCSPLTYAISQGATADEVEAMLKKASSVQPPEDKFISPLGVAAENGNLAVARVLLDHGADPNWRGQPPYQLLRICPWTTLLR